MSEEPAKEPMPKKTCMITLMFGIKDDDTALNVKKAIDDIVKDIEPKRYNFSINET